MSSFHDLYNITPWKSNSERTLRFYDNPLYLKEKKKSQYKYVYPLGLEVTNFCNSSPIRVFQLSWLETHGGFIRWVIKQSSMGIIAILGES